MRKLLLFIILIHFSFFGKATVFNITVQNFQFTPSSIPNVLVGDIIKFNWANGSHTTTCDPSIDNTTSLPSGAATWDHNMNAGSTTFSYTVTKVGTYNYVCIPHAPTMSGSFVVSSPLPVILTSFKVNNINGDPYVTWSTTTEVNCNYFSIQKSQNGKDFLEVGKIKSVGNSSESHNYSFTDNQLQNNNSRFLYYMLEIVDKDGKKAFSDIQLFKSLNNEQKLIVSVGPNPLQKNSHLMLEYTSDTETTMDFNIYNLEGKSVFHSNVNAVKGVNMGHFHMGNLSSGEYTLSVSLNGKTESRIITIK